MSELHASIPSLTAAGYYLVVAWACVLATMVARRFQNPAASFWLTACLAMLLFSGLRLVALEETLRNLLRLMMTNMGLLEARSAYQAPVVVLICIVAIALIWLVLGSIRSQRISKLETSVIVGRLALIGLVVLLCLRIVSLHAVDTILFTRFLGPIRLNWIFDIGLATALAVAALGFASISRNMR